MADAAVQPVVAAEKSVQPWPLPSRILFRFACCYWLLYALPEGGRISILYNIPGAPFLAQPYVRLWHSVVPWVAIHIFHVTGRAATYFRTGSGDTTLQYVQNLLYLVISLIATLVWSILDRRRPHYRAMHGWLRLLVRYTLAFTLFGYGFAKVFPLQFSPPGFARLIEPYGEFSPMGALWWFMGASIPYIIFSGAAEVTGGLLLLFRRTTSLGAMVSSAVMANVVALNFCYDVPVKLYSSNILLMAVLLLAPDLGRLFSVLVLNRAAAPADLTGPRFSRRWRDGRFARISRIASVTFWVLFVGYNLVGHVIGGWKSYKQTYLNPVRPPLYGLYDVENEYSNWRKVAIQYAGGLTVRTSDDKVLNYSTQYSGQTVTLNGKEVFRWSGGVGNHILLEGDGKLIRLRQIDASKFLLLSRGFHWINEMPLNR